MKSFLQDAIERQEPICLTGTKKGWTVEYRPVTVNEVFSVEELERLKLNEFECFGAGVYLNKKDELDANHLRVQIAEDEFDLYSEVIMAPWGDGPRETHSILVEEDALYRFAQLVVAAIDAKRSAHNS